MQNVKPKFDWPHSAFRALYDDRIDYEPARGMSAQANRNQMANEGPIPEQGGNSSNAGNTAPSVPQGLDRPSIWY